VSAAAPTSEPIPAALLEMGLTAPANIIHKHSESQQQPWLATGDGGTDGIRGGGLLMAMWMASNLAVEK